MEVGGVKTEKTDELSPGAPIELKIPPSILSKRILCPAYTPAPFDRANAFKFRALHALTTITVIARHLKLGYRLIAAERGGSGYRIDLLFESTSSGKCNWTVFSTLKLFHNTLTNKTTTTKNDNSHFICSPAMLVNFSIRLD